MAISDRFKQDSEAPSLCLMSWVSWRSIFAGGITSVAIGIVLALLGLALGFTVVEPLSSDPMDGVGMTFGIWTFVSGIVSLMVGGFVAGIFAGQRGCTHGFLVWSAVLILGAFSTSIAAGMALQSIGSLVGTGAQTAASIISDKADNLAEQGMNAMQDDSRPDRDAPRIMGILRDTEVRQLQPSFIMGQLGDARRDMTSSFQRITLDNYDSVISSFLARQKERLDTVRNSQIDRNAAAQGLMQTRGISRPEADGLLDEALTVYYYRLDQLESGLEQAQRNFEDTREYLKQVSEDARRKADEAAAAAAKSALLAAVALIFGAIGSMIGGWFGVRFSLQCTRV